MAENQQAEGQNDEQDKAGTLPKAAQRHGGGFAVTVESMSASSHRRLNRKHSTDRNYIMTSLRN